MTEFGSGWLAVRRPRTPHPFTAAMQRAVCKVAGKVELVGSWKDEADRKDVPGVQEFCGRLRLTLLGASRHRQERPSAVQPTSRQMADAAVRRPCVGQSAKGRVTKSRG